MNPKETLKKPQRNLQKPYESIYSEVPVGHSARAAGIYIYTMIYPIFKQYHIFFSAVHSM